MINIWKDPEIEVIFLKTLTSGATNIDCMEIFFVTIMALILGLLITLDSTYKISMRLVQYFKITRKFGDIDVWGFVFNSKQSENIEWVTLRDLEYDLAYDGWFEAFSDDSKNAELLLRDVSVYKNSTGDFLYQIGAMYVSRKRENITLEFKGVPINDEFKILEKENRYV